MEKRNWIVYFASGNYWNGGITGRHHLLKRLSNDYNILFINSLGLAGIKNISKNTILSRITSKLKSYLKYLKSTKDFKVFSPISLPVDSKFTEKLSEKILLIQVKVVSKILGIKNPIIWVCSPKAALLLDKIKYKKLIYNYSDKFTSYREISNRELITKFDSMLKDKADIIISNLLKTYEELQHNGCSKKTIYLPHGVDYFEFNKVCYNDVSIPKDLKTIPKPIIGYYGSLTDSNDWELIKYCANQREQYSFVFIGTPRKDIPKEVFNIKNIYFLGYKEYKDLPRYLKLFDLCILFWKVTDWIYNSSPLKTKEFLAMGKPIVSVHIYELEKKYSSLISFAASYREFLTKIDFELLADSKEKQNLRMEAVKNDTWDIIARKLSMHISGDE